MGLAKAIFGRAWSLAGKIDAKNVGLMSPAISQKSRDVFAGNLQAVERTFRVGSLNMRYPAELADDGWVRIVDGARLSSFFRGVNHAVESFFLVCAELEFCGDVIHAGRGHQLLDGAHRDAMRAIRADGAMRISRISTPSPCGRSST